MVTNLIGSLFLKTEIDPAIVQAYRETEYRVHTEPPFTLRVGQASADLIAHHKHHKTDCSAFLTAWNPFSQSLDDAANASGQAALAQELSRRSLSYLLGLGQHPANGWAGEESFLVFGLTLEAAKVLGSRFEQNALIWNGSDGVAQLVLLR
jgi:hypothetical protein